MGPHSLAVRSSWTLYSPVSPGVLLVVVVDVDVALVDGEVRVVRREIAGTTDEERAYHVSIGRRSGHTGVEHIHPDFEADEGGGVAVPLCDDPGRLGATGR